MFVVFHFAFSKKDIEASYQKKSSLVFMEREMEFLIKFL